MHIFHNLSSGVPIRDLEFNNHINNENFHNKFGVSVLQIVEKDNL